MPKVIYKADHSSRGFITSMLAPVNCRHEPHWGLRQTVTVLLLAVGTLVLLRLFLAN